jgi:hypothetical protein
MNSLISQCALEKKLFCVNICIQKVKIFIRLKKKMNSSELRELPLVENCVSGTCPICLYDLQGGQLRMLPCCHSFHENCIFSWLKINVQCPMCRNPVKKKQTRLGNIESFDNKLLFIKFLMIYRANQSSTFAQQHCAWNGLLQRTLG